MWYVVADKDSSYLGEKGRAIWTLSQDPKKTGWNTDSGFPGYGMTYETAKALADAANAAGVVCPDEPDPAR